MTHALGQARVQLQPWDSPLPGPSHGENAHSTDQEAKAAASVRGSGLGAWIPRASAPVVTAP